MIARKRPFADINEPNQYTILWWKANDWLKLPKINKIPTPLMELIERFFYLIFLGFISCMYKKSEVYPFYVFLPFYRCWSKNPDDRPCLEEIEETLKIFIEVNILIYNLFLIVLSGLSKHSPTYGL